MMGDMLKTRDLFLFVVSLIFLGLLITATIWWQAAHQTVVHTTTPNFTNKESVVSASSVPQQPMDRAALIASFKEKIAADTSTIVPQPSVPDTSVAPTEPTSPSNQATIKHCTGADDTLSRVAKWPLSGVSFKVVEGARLVQYSAPPTNATTSSALVTTTLLQLPAEPTPAATPHCVPSAIVGVSTNGYLLYNTDVRPYRTATADTLVGYARDGYPIYGPYDGPVDQCGGYQTPSGYRYSLSPNRNYMIGCFTGTPQPFHL